VKGRGDPARATKGTAGWKAVPFPFLNAHTHELGGRRSGRLQQEKNRHRTAIGPAFLLGFLPKTADRESAALPRVS